MDRGAWWAMVLGVTKSQTLLSNSAQHSTEAGPSEVREKLEVISDLPGPRFQEVGVV